MYINVDKNPQEYILILHKPSISERHTLIQMWWENGQNCCSQLADKTSESLQINNRLKLCTFFPEPPRVIKSGKIAG